MAFDQSRSFIRDYALIQGINLLVNMWEQLNQDIVDIKKVFTNWKQLKRLNLEDQVEIIFKTSVHDKRSKYVVYCLNKLSNEFMDEFPVIEYAISLTKDCLNAIRDAIQASGHLFSKTRIESLEAAFKSGHIVKAKGLPYFEPEDKEEKERKEIEGKEGTYVLEYKGDK